MYVQQEALARAEAERSIALDRIPEILETLQMVSDALWARDQEALGGLLRGPLREEMERLQQHVALYLLFAGFVESKDC